MPRNRIPIDKVRASREGHEFHEAWTARKALQLLLPTDNLIGIAVEGLDPSDQATASSATVEVADLTLYYGKGSTFRRADTVKIIQFKYSISSCDDEFRASHARKTINKFAAGYKDYLSQYGKKKVNEKLHFELITNRPIYPALEQAIAGIIVGRPLSGEVKKQADQFKAACQFKGETLVDFASKCLLTGLAGNLPDYKRDLSRSLVNWSATTDPLARARLGALKQMVRDKAGHAGNNRNVIMRVDVLASLDLSDIDELLPCPASLPEVGKVVEREQLRNVISLIPTIDRPLLIHAVGGIGKTVFLESLAQSLSEVHTVLLFDCFGGGSYRAPEDSRHLPRNGLLHMVNTLACQGLCDPLLPGSDRADSLFRTFRQRLSQCMETLSTASKEKGLIILIDAIDNAAQHAKDMGDHRFQRFSWRACTMQDQFAE